MSFRKPRLTAEEQKYSAFSKRIHDEVDRTSKRLDKKDDHQFNRFWKMTAEQTKSELCSGVIVRKHHRLRSIERIIFLSPDGEELRWALVARVAAKKSASGARSRSQSCRVKTPGSFKGRMRLVDIRDIRLGAKSSGFTKLVSANRCISIITSKRSLDLEFGDDSERTRFEDQLKSLLVHYAMPKRWRVGIFDNSSVGLFRSTSERLNLVDKLQDEYHEEDEDDDGEKNELESMLDKIQNSNAQLEKEYAEMMELLAEKEGLAERESATEGAALGDGDDASPSEIDQFDVPPPSPPPADEFDVPPPPPPPPIAENAAGSSNQAARLGFAKQPPPPPPPEIEKNAARRSDLAALRINKIKNEEEDGADELEAEIARLEEENRKLAMQARLAQLQDENDRLQDLCRADSEDFDV